MPAQRAGSRRLISCEIIKNHIRVEPIKPIRAGQLVRTRCNEDVAQLWGGGCNTTKFQESLNELIMLLSISTRCTLFLFLFCKSIQNIPKLIVLAF